MIKMDCLRNTTHDVRHEKHAIKHKTDKNWGKNWNNVFFRLQRLHR